MSFQQGVLSRCSSVLRHRAGRTRHINNILYRHAIAFASTAPRIPKAHFHSSAIRHNEAFKDPYDTLGLKKSATGAEIKKAYYKLAKKYHPDINKEPDAEKKFHDLQNAYEILSDDTKRQQFDQFGPAAFGGGGGGGAGGAGSPFGSQFHDFSGFTNASGGSPFGGINFEDLFGAAFGGGGAGAGAGRGGSGGRSSPMYRQYRGDPIEIVHKVSFKDAVFGAKNVQLKFSALDPCGTCSGTGMKPNTHKVSCTTCHGSGSTVHVRGGFQMMSTCPTCNGEGTMKRPQDNCTSCHGEGVQANRGKSITVDLPHGLQDGDVVRIPGQGSYPDIAVEADLQDSIKLSRGDILVRIRVDKDPSFSIRNKYDIWYDKEIPITTAALGGTITIPTVDGQKIRIKVAPGTQYNQVISIPNMGVPRTATLRGDMKVQYKIVVKKPQSLAEKCLWEALADVTNDDMAKKTMQPGTATGTAINEEILKKQKQQEEKHAKKDDDNTLKRLENFITNTFKKIKGDKKN